LLLFERQLHVVVITIGILRNCNYQTPTRLRSTAEPILRWFCHGVGVYVRMYTCVCVGGLSARTHDEEPLSLRIFIHADYIGSTAAPIYISRECSFLLVVIVLR